MGRRKIEKETTFLESTMKRLITFLILITASPGLIANPPAATHHLVSSAATSALTIYDEITEFLKDIENGILDEIETVEDLQRLNHFVISLTRLGLMPDDPEAEEQLERDIAELLECEHVEMTSLAHIDDAQIILAVLNNHHDYKIHQCGFFKHPFKSLGNKTLNAIHQTSKMVRSAAKKTAKLIKKHPKATAIGVAILAAGAATYHYCTHDSKSTADALLGAGAAGIGALATTETHNPQPAIREHIKDTLASEMQEYKKEISKENFIPKEPLKSHALPIEESGRILTPLFADRAIDRLHREHSLPDSYSSVINNYSTNENLSTLAFRARGEKALSSGYYNQAVVDFSKVIEKAPTDADAYLGRASSHFNLGEYNKSISDFHQYTVHTPTQATPSLTDFTKSFAKGVTKGACDSGEGLILILSEFATHPIHTAKQMAEGLTTLATMVKEKEWETLGDALVPELKQLITQWDTLSSDEKGSLAGYAIGKHGADLIVPTAAIKGTGALTKQGVKACRMFQAGKETLVLEAASLTNNPTKVSYLIAQGNRAEFLIEELGYSGRQIKELEHAGKLDKTLREAVFKWSPEMQASAYKARQAQKALKKYKNIPLTEAEIRTKIHETGYKTYPRPEGIPSNYIVEISDKGAGIKYMHPKDCGTSIRVMPGKAHSPFPYQRQPYVTVKRKSKNIDKFGNEVHFKSPKAHIPLLEFSLRNIE